MVCKAITVRTILIMSFAFVLLFSAPVSAVMLEASTTSVDDLISQAAGNKAMIDDFNKNSQNLPGILKSLFGTERMNIHFGKGDAQKILGVATKKGNITEIQAGALSKPTLNVYVSDKAINDISKSQDTGAAIASSIKSKDITYSAIGIGHKIKYGLANLAYTVYGWFRKS
jgi:hypothetical protein